MRKSNLEVLNSKETDLNKEYQRLESLFSQNISIVLPNSYSNPYPLKFLKITIETYAESYFIKWEHKETCRSIADMRDDLGISKEQLSNGVKEEQLLTFIELVINLLELIRKNYYHNENNETNIDDISNHISILLDKLGYKPSHIEKIDYWYIVTKDQASTAAAETHPDIADKVIEYRRFDLKGNLERKKEIIYHMGLKFEAIKDKLKGTDFNKITENAGFLLNNLNIRHNNLDKDTENKKINMIDKELEEWYDKTYDTLLLALMSSHYIDNIKPQINEFKETLKTKI